MVPATTPHRDDIKKNTIYIDVDDEITTIIDKLKHADQRIVALVLPKRASVMQSVVNMKLLKRSADNAHKHLVLITSEASLLPLAGAVGLYVASNLQSKPLIPAAAGATRALDGAVRLGDSDEEFGDDLEETDDFNSDALADKPVGQLAGLGATTAATAAAANSSYTEPETIELDNDDEAVSAPAAATAVTATGAAAAGSNAAAVTQKGKNKKLKVPNFHKFRLLLILAVLLIVLLVGGFIYANAVLPKATITLATNSTNIATTANLTLDPKATTLDLSTDTVPAAIVSKQQTGSQQVSSSGQVNNGSKASGSVTMTAGSCTADVPDNVPAGTGLSSGGLTFITQQETDFTPTVSNGKCVYTSDNDTPVTAQNGGANYNIAASSFTVADRTDVTAKSSDSFNGGTDNIVKTVTQADIDSASQKISSSATNTSSIANTLSSKLQSSGYVPISKSLNAGTPTITSSATVGQQADTVTVTQTTTYTMYGASQADLTKIITSNVTSQINPTQQQILQNGSSSAKYVVSSPVSSGPLQMTLSATSLAGPHIQVDQLASQMAGKKTGDVQSALKAIPGVSNVTVTYSPFWVSSVPNKASRVTIVIDKAPGN